MHDIQRNDSIFIKRQQHTDDHDDEFKTDKKNVYINFDVPARLTALH